MKSKVQVSGICIILKKQIKDFLFNIPPIFPIKCYYEPCAGKSCLHSSKFCSQDSYPLYSQPLRSSWLPGHSKAEGRAGWKWPCHKRTRQESLPTPSCPAAKRGGRGRECNKRATGGQGTSSNGRGEGDQNSRHVRVRGQTSKINQRVVVNSPKASCRGWEEKPLISFPEEIWSHILCR